MGRCLMKKKFIHLTVGFFVAYFWISALAYADGYTRWTRYLENNKFGFIPKHKPNYFKM